MIEFEQGYTNQITLWRNDKTSLFALLLCPYTDRLLPAVEGAEAKVCASSGRTELREAKRCHHNDDFRPSFNFKTMQLVAYVIRHDLFGLS